jgi:TatD DNase family protein
VTVAVYVDTHCHLQDQAFGEDVDAVMARATTAGVIRMIDCGYGPSSNAGVLELARRWDCVRPAVGFHPHEASQVSPAMLTELASQARTPGVVAIGEIGLDFYRDHSPHEVQRSVLSEQLEIAVRLGLPVSVHSRGAEHEIRDLLAPYAAGSPLAAQGRAVGVMHCFGGTLEQALCFVELGFLVSIACVATYPRGEGTRELARELPLESLVVETDSPYLPPQTMRGKRNEPAMVVAAVEALAAARSIPVTEAAAATTSNAARLFHLTLGAASQEAVEV